MSSICREQPYTKKTPSANSPNLPRAAVYLGAAVIELRRKAGDEIGGPVARQMLDIADILHRLIPRLERLEQLDQLNLLAGGR